MSSSSSTSSGSDAIRKKTRYSGTSHTSQWRKRKRGLSSSEDDSDVGAGHARSINEAVPGDDAKKSCIEASDIETSKEPSCDSVSPSKAGDENCQFQDSIDKGSMKAELVVGATEQQPLFVSCLSSQHLWPDSNLSTSQDFICPNLVELDCTVEGVSSLQEPVIATCSFDNDDSLLKSSQEFSTSNSAKQRACDKEVASVHEPVIEKGSFENDHSLSQSSLNTAQDSSYSNFAGNSKNSSDSDSDTSVAAATSSEWEPSTDEFSSDLECFNAHFLEEAPGGDEDPPAGDEGEGGPDGPDDDEHEPEEPEDPEDNPDDPDPENNENATSSSSEESDEENDHEVATFSNNQLNVNIQLNRNLTKGEVICLQLASAVRHQMTFEKILDQFKNLNVLFGPGVFPESKTKLWSIILLNKNGIQFHVYCGRRNCGQYIGRRDRIHEIARCGCGYQVPVAKARFFVTLDWKTQLRYFLSIPHIWEKLQYPQTRQKISPTAIEDILDGALYRRLRENNGPLSNPHNFSHIFNMDGCQVSKKGSLKVVPVYIRLNELPPEMRQKFHFVAAVYVDHHEPANYETFLRLFIRQARHLENQGINWRPDGVHEVNSRFIALGFNVDSPVRYCILNLSRWDSEYGCTYCTHRGVRLAGSQRYPLINLHGIPHFQDRTHQSMVDAMQLVGGNEEIETFEGQEGPSALMLLPHLDLRDGQAEDDLHHDHEGTAAHLTELLLTTRLARVNEEMPRARLLRLVNNRLLSFKTPCRLSRKPRSILKRANWNGSEWRNWLIYYAIPCLTDPIKPEYLDILASVSHACHLLSQDVIEPADFDTAEELFNQAAASFELYFGVERIRYNFHVTTRHKVRSVRNLGNPFATSTYNFESLHRKVIGRVTSPKGAIMQIITRILLYMAVTSAQYDERLSEEVRLRIEDMLNPYQIREKHQVAPHVFLVGRGVERVTTNEEAAVLAREGINVRIITEYHSIEMRNTWFWSEAAGRAQDIKSCDSFIYSSQETFCTIRTIFSFLNNGEEQCGMFVSEHDVLAAVRVVRHLTTMQNADADLFHFITFDQVRWPAVKMIVGNITYAACVPNSFDID